MAPVVLEKRTTRRRLDIPLNDEERAQLDLSASLAGMKTTQWAKSRLKRIAAEEIEASRTETLSPVSFDEFLQALDEGATETGLEFLAMPSVLDKQ